MAQEGVDEGKDALVRDEREKAAAEKEKAARVEQGLPADKTTDEKARAAAGTAGHAAKSVFRYERTRRNRWRERRTGPLRSRGRRRPSRSSTRWCVAAVRILGRYRETKESLARLFVSGDTLVAVDRSGRWIVPLPVETLAWTAEAVAQVPSAGGAPAGRELWLLGTATPRARKELESRGWTVRESVLPASS